MAWLEAHQELPRHPKTKRFARMLKISIPQAVGHLFLLWWWALDYAENGDLSKYDAYDLADAVQWDGDPEEFLKAMIDCGPGGTSGFIEKDSAGNIFIHDWDKYSGRLVEKREKNRKRKAQERKNNLSKEDEKTSKIRAKKSKYDYVSTVAKTEKIEDKKVVADMSRVTDESVAGVSQGYITQHNTTQQNKTKQNKTESSSPHPPAPDDAADAEKVNLGEIVSLWNATLAPLGFSRVLRQTQRREQALEVLLNLSPDRKKFRWWLGIFDSISSSEFLRTSSWFTIDWLLNEHNLVKVLEGTYNRDRQKKTTTQPEAQKSQNLTRASSIDEILARHQAKNSNTIDAEYSVIGEGEIDDGGRSSGFR